MRNTRLLDEAVTDAMEAINWYECQCAGLGYEFGSALEAALDLLEDEITPLVAMPSSENGLPLKRLVLSRFPFDVVVLPHDEEFLVVAIAHHARKPWYWLTRLD